MSAALRIAWSWLRRYGWVVLAALIVAAWAIRRRPGAPDLVDVQRRIHEADVDARLARRRYDADYEAEVRRVRDVSVRQLDLVDLRELDDAALLAQRDDELLRTYRQRAKDLGVETR